MTNTLDLEAIESRANAAIPGPWYLVYDDFVDEVSIRQEDADGQRRRGSYVEVANSAQCRDESSPDAEFIAHAREDIPALIARIRELESAVWQVREAIDESEIAAALTDGPRTVRIDTMLTALERAA